MTRKALYPISKIFINRWSSRALSGEHVSKAQLMKLFEAARWAPSSYNEQPWRFVYTNKGTMLFNKLIESMIPFNQEWAQQAPVLVVLASKTFFERNGKASHLNSFDAGAAWMSMALQASEDGLIAHALGGFDHDKVRACLHIPPEFKIEIMIAIGKPGKKELLSPELQLRESPNERKPLHEIVFEDEFKIS